MRALYHASAKLRRMKRIVIGFAALIAVACYCGCKTAQPAAAPAPPPPPPAGTQADVAPPAPPSSRPHHSGIIIPAAPPTVRSVTILNHLVKGEFDDVEADFNPTMKDAVPSSKLAEVWNGVVAQYGAFKSLGDPAATTEDGYRVVYVPMTFEKGVLRGKLVYDNTNYVAGFWIQP
jgi:Protein of unknown function (DUF3887)